MKKTDKSKSDNKNVSTDKISPEAVRIKQVQIQVRIKQKGLIQTVNTQTNLISLHASQIRILLV
jgi:hypothetical protein